MPQKRSVIWSLTKEEFVALVARSKSSTEILRFFGMENIGGNNRTLWRRLKEDECDTSHFSSRLHGLEAYRYRHPAKPLEDVMVENSTYSRGHLKKRLISSGALDNKCILCGQLPMWNGKPLVMRLDHINGKRGDHREENLRLVCPNCDSQLETFCGRHINRSTLPKCGQCNKRLSKRHCKLCLKCSTKHRTKIGWPDNETLVDMVKNSNYLTVAKKLGVSDVSVHKRVKRFLADRLKVGHGALTTRMDTGSNPPLPARSNA